MSLGSDSGSVVGIGTVSLDVVRFLDPAGICREVELSFGGVCNNAMCTLGRLMERPRFVSVQFSGVLAKEVEAYFIANQVDWRPLPSIAPLSFYEAEVNRYGQLQKEYCIENGSVSALTASLLQDNADVFDGASEVLTCTDIAGCGDGSAFIAVHSIARNQDATFWLFSTSLAESADTTEIARVAEAVRLADVIGINLPELNVLSGRCPQSLREIAKCVNQMVATNAVCLVTLGARGAILCLHGASEFLYQPVPHLTPQSPIGAGDVLFASLLAGRRIGEDWADALSHASARTIRYLMRPCGQSRFEGLLDIPIVLPQLQRLQYDPAHR